MKILIVDDFSTMRRIIKNLLRDLGFTNTAEADDGTTALPMLHSGNFDFLVTDWNMPGMTGIDLLRAVRADERLKHLPVLMVTAEAKRDQIIEAAGRGQRLCGQTLHRSGPEGKDREDFRAGQRLKPAKRVSWCLVTIPRATNSNRP